MKKKSIDTTFFNTQQDYLYNNSINAVIMLNVQFLI
jgi:hypothetical protein